MSASYWKEKEAEMQAEALEVQQVEVDLGPNDILVLQCGQVLTIDQRESLRASLDAVIRKEGRQALVLDGGMTAMVLHRYAEDDAGDEEAAQVYMDGTSVL